MIKIWEREERNAKGKGSFRFSPIFPVILHHGRTRFKAPLEFQELVANVSGMDEFVSRFRPKLIDLSAIGDNELPKDDPQLFAAPASLQTVFGKELSEPFQDSLRRLGALFDQPGIPEFIEVVLKYITANAREMDQGKNQVILTEIKNRKGEPIMATIAEKWIEGLRK